MKRTKALEEIREYAIEQLKASTGVGEYGCDLHHELFNADYYIIGTWKAEKWLGGETFEAIREIQEYEKANFGEVSTDLAEPEKIVNMYVYILGEKVLQGSKTLADKWNDRLERGDIQKIIKELS